MTFGTGPQAVVDILQTNWQVTRSGRPDVPDLVRDGSNNPSSDPADADEPGRILILRNREEVSLNHAVFDVIHCYQPEGDPGVWTDNGYKEENVVQGIQVDIDLTDRTDPDTGERITARERMIGNRDTPSFAGEDPPYPGILGEVKYILETVRRGYEEYDKVSVTPISATLKNSDATVRLDVELEIIAKNTVQ